MSNNETTKQEVRCSWCGWPLVHDWSVGCVPGNCSQRPLPDHLYDRDRAIAEATHASTREYIEKHYPVSTPSSAATPEPLELGERLKYDPYAVAELVEKIKKPASTPVHPVSTPSSAATPEEVSCDLCNAPCIPKDGKPICPACLARLCPDCQDYWADDPAYSRASSCLHHKPAAPSSPHTSALVVGEPCPTCKRKYLGEMGPGQYSCVSCGMGMVEPCEHQKNLRDDSSTFKAGEETDEQ